KRPPRPDALAFAAQETDDGVSIRNRRRRLMPCCRRSDHPCRPPRTWAGVWLRFLLAVGVVLAAALLSARRADPSPGEIAALVRQLGSESYEEREAAGRHLETTGKPALPALRRGPRHRHAAGRRR